MSKQRFSFELDFGGKIYTCFLLLLSMVLIAISPSSIALPIGWEVKDGSINIENSSGENGVSTQQITQASSKGIIDWQSFNIGEKERVTFVQPNANAITLNRVVGGSDPSKILGQLIATGQVWLINPAGVLFGSSAIVDVAGLLATTANIRNDAFMAGNYQFSQGSNGLAKVVNQGSIKAADKGFVYLVAPTVENIGVIEARLGKVVLGSVPASTAATVASANAPASTYTVDFYGDELIQFAVPENVNTNINKAIIQSGKIKADGGKVLLSANTGKGVVDQAINMDGVIEADSIGTKNGEIVLMSGNEGGAVMVGGKLAARGERAGERGGKVVVTGEKVGLLAESNIDVSGNNGGGEVLVGGDYRGEGNVPTAKITYVDATANIDASANNSGDGGKVIVWADKATVFGGKIAARGGINGGNGGLVETSGKEQLDVRSTAKVDTAASFGDAKAGTWLLDPRNVEIVGDNVGSNNGSWDGLNPNTWIPNNADATSRVTVSAITGNLSNSNVIITTKNSSVIDLGFKGDITLLADLISFSSNTLSLIADNNIIIDSAITSFNPGGLLLQAKGDVRFTPKAVISDVQDVTVRAGGKIYFDNSSILTFGNQSYESPVIVKGSALFGTSINMVDNVDVGINITFSDRVDADSSSAQNTLNISAGGGRSVVRFVKPIGMTNKFSVLNLGIANLEINTDYLPNEYLRPILGYPIRDGYVSLMPQLSEQLLVQFKPVYFGVESFTFTSPEVPPTPSFGTGSDFIPPTAGDNNLPSETKDTAASLTQLLNDVFPVHHRHHIFNGINLYSLGISKIDANKIMPPVRPALRTEDNFIDFTAKEIFPNFAPTDIGL